MDLACGSHRTAFRILPGWADQVIFDSPGAVAEQEHFRLYPDGLWAALTILVELTGPILIVLGRFVWLGAGGLGVLTAVAMSAANNFWAMQGPARFVAVNSFFEHIGLVAGCVMAALIDEHVRRDQRLK